MDSAHLVEALRRHEPELRRLGLVRLGVFGSVARGEADAASDVDLLAGLDEARALSLLDVIHIENRLADLLGRKVDLVDEASLDPRIAPAVARSLVRAF